MRSHLFDIDTWDSHYIFLPPEKFVIHTAPNHWYKEGIDPERHAHTLFLNRGIFLLNEWWEQENLIINYPINASSSYRLDVLPELELLIRDLHKKLAPYQKIDDCELVFGIGATQLIHASLYATALAHSIKKNPPINNKTLISTLYATQQEPGYIEYGSLIEIMHQALINWIRFRDYLEVDQENLLEFVTTPNNPDGRIIKPVTGAYWTIHDRVNHWPFFMNADSSDFYLETLENDKISIFSLSKVLSFSGSRLGYAFVKDKQIANYMRHYVIMATHGLVSDSQFHAAAALRYLLQDHLYQYTNWITQNLNERWARLRSALKGKELVLLNEQGPASWVKAPGNAQEYLLKKYNVECTYGTEYGVTEEYARFNMLSKTIEFNEFIWRLENL